MVPKLLFIYIAGIITGMIITYLILFAYEE